MIEILFPKVIKKYMYFYGTDVIFTIFNSI